MTQQQQPQQKPGIQPSLADLDKPPVKQDNDQGQNQNNDQNQNQNQSNDQDNDKDQNNQNQQQNNPDGDKDKKPSDQQDQDTQDSDGNDNDDASGDTDPVAFFAEVTKLRGDEFKWEFPEGVDPLTPEGVHHAINQAVDHAMDVFEDNIMKGDPRAYAYMLHRNKGGSDEDFFSTKTEVLPEWDVLKGSVDLQQAFYKRSLIRKGINEEEADLIVKNAIEKNKLVGVVETTYNAMKEADQRQAAELLRISKENEKREEQMIQRMGATLQDYIINNKGLNITIPDAKRGTFLQFVHDHMYLDTTTGNWYVRQSISNENFTRILESLYYQSVGGNMDDIITKKASTQKVNELKLRMQKDKTKTTSKTDPNKKSANPGVMPAMSEL